MSTSKSWNMNLAVLKDWAPLISIVIALSSLVIVFYKDFIQGAKLETVISTVVFVRMPEQNKSMIIEQMLLDDLLSGNPSDQAKIFIDSDINIANAVKTRNRELARNYLVNLSIIASREGKKVIYDAPPERIEKYFGDKNFALGFYVPLNLVNTGRKSGDITTLILEMRSKTDPKQRWVYSCFMEIKPEEFTKFSSDKPMGTIVGKLFPGVSIGPSANFRLDAFMIPFDTVKDKIISKNSLMPGEYTVQIIGFNSKNAKTLVSNISTITINKRLLIDVFNGGNIVNNLSIDDHIEQLLNE